MEKQTNPNIIGRIDKADFPKLNLRRIRVKIDTGAYTSSFHCCQIEETAEGKLRVVFLDPDDPKYTGKVYLFKTYSKKSVKSSNGKVEDRFVISTKIRFHRRIYTAQFSLSYRGDMRYPVLIGRKFLTEHNFVVNPQLRNYLHQMQKADKLSMKK